MRNSRRLILLIVVVMLLQLIAVPLSADTTGYYSTIGAKAYKLRNSYDLVNTGYHTAMSIKATVLVGAVSNSPYQQSINYKVTPAPKYTYVDSAGNIYAEILIDEIKPKETKKITVEKEFINSGVSYSRDIYRMGADYSQFEQGINNGQYYEPGDKVETTASEIANKALDFDVSKTKVNLEKDIYDFVNMYITYDTNPLYANKGALSAIETGRGVCDEYASLFTALSRDVGVPSRVATGYWLDEPLKAGVWNDVSDKAHAWPEFYMPNVGWIPAEPTFFLTVNGIRTPDDRNHFANLAADDVHLLNGYQNNDIKDDISISYSYYSTTNLNIKFDQQAVMPIASPSSADAFTDISSSWAKSYINKLYNEGILFAKQDSLYKPNDNITRAEFSAYLVNTLRLESKDSAMTFKDVKESSPYASFIKTASAYGLIKGDQGYFRPNDTITREEAAVIMERAIELLNVGHAALLEPQFVDMSKVDSWAKDAVKLIYNMKIMAGKPGNIFDPRNFTTRAEASKLLDNFIIATE